MEQQLYELLRQCTVRISGDNGHATGFFVARGLILTCAHVVIRVNKSSSSLVEVSWNGQSFSGQVTKNVSGSDLALVQVELADHPCVYLHEKVEHGNQFYYAYGYSEKNPDGDPATFFFEGKLGGPREKLKLKMGQAPPGMSGAPLLNIETGYVCGIVQKSRDPGSDLGGLAIPISTVFHEFPELVDQQRQFHQVDKRWLNCHKDIIERMKYLDGMRKKYGSIEPLIAPEKGESFSLQAVFQPLKLRNRPLAAEDLEREQRRAFLGESTRSENDPRIPFPKPEKQRDDELLPPSQPIEFVENGTEALQRSPQGRMIVLGGPGTGKSTVLRYLVDEACQKAQTDYAAPIPIFISLAAYSESKVATTLEQYLSEVVNRVGMDAHYAQTLWKAVQEKQAFICLDGLDEVASGPRENLIDEINTWASGEKGNYWIISSRFTEYKNGQFKHSQFTEWELQPLNHALRLLLAQQLIPELHRSLRSSQKSVDPLLFVKTLETHAQAAAWGENPLLFSLAAAVFISNGVLPLSRAALYREVIEAILKMREKVSIKRKTLWRVEADLALKLYEKNQRTFTLDDLLPLLSVIHKEQNGTWDAEDIANRIMVSGTLEVLARETYGFRHQTFQEYLAAVGLSQQIISSDRAHREDLAWKMRTYSRWTEVLRLMIGELSQLEKFSESYKREGKVAVQNWLRKLIDQRTTEEGDPGNLGLALVLKSLNEITGTDWWRQPTMMSLAKKTLSIWVDELFNATRENRQGKQERLVSLAQDISYLPRQIIDETLKQLVQALWDQDRNIRNVVCEVLQGLRQSPTEMLIEAALKDSDASVRQAALKVLGAQREQVPLEPLLIALHDSNKDVRQVAEEAFVKQGEHMPLEQLLELLRNDDWRIRAAAANALGERGEHAPLEPLLSALHDKQLGVRGDVLKALDKLGERVPIEPLLSVIYGKDEVEEDHNVSVPDFFMSRMLRDQAARVLAKKGNFLPTDFLIDRLLNGVFYEQSMAAKALGDQNAEEAISPLIHVVLHSDDIEVRTAAVEALGKLGKGVPIDFFTNLLQDSDINVQREAMQALAQREEEAALEPLLAFFQGLGVATLVLKPSILTILGERLPREMLLDLLRHDVPELRRVVGAIIENLQEQVSLQDILHAFHDERERLAAIKILERQEETNAFELLMSLIYDKNYEVRNAAFKALEQQPDRVPRELLLELLRYDAVRSNVIEVLKRQREGLQLNLLTDFLHNRYVQSIFLDDLDRKQDPERVGLLTEFLQSSDKEMRSKAIKALKKLGSFTPPESLLAFLHDDTDYIRQAAVVVLGELDEQVSIDIFLQAMHDTDSSVRHLAAEALLKRLLKQQLREGTPIPEEYIKAVDDVNYLIRPNVICDLWAEGENISLETFLRILHHEDFGIPLHASVVLQYNGERVPLNVLIDLLSDENTRKSAIKALEGKEEAVPIDPLLSLLRDEDKDVRGAVVTVLGKQGEHVPVPQLLPLLHDPDNGIRREVVKVLGKLNERVPTEHFLPLLHDIDNSVRYEVITVLGSRIPREQLFLLLYDKDGNVRSAAITALGRQGENALIKYLVEALGDQAEQVRSAALEVVSTRAPDVLADVTREAIAILNGEPAGTILGSLSRITLCQQAGELQLARRELLDELTKFLSWPHWQVRMSAANAFGSIRRHIPGGAIRDLYTLRRQDPVHTVREAADNALAEILSLETGIEEELSREQDKHQEVELLSHRTFAIREGQSEPVHADTATDFNNLALLYSTRSKYQEAEPFYQRDLKIIEERLGPRRPDTATSLSNLAGIYDEQGKYQEAETLYQRSLKLAEEQLGPTHRDTGIILNSLSGIYYKQGRYQEAEPLAQRALKIAEERLGSRHLTTATGLSNLAGIYDEQGKYQEAEPLYQRALAITEELLGPMHPDTASCLNSFGMCYYKQGKYNQAEPLYRRALTIYEQIVRTEDSDMALILNNLGMLYLRQGIYEQAEPLLQQAMTIWRQELGLEHPLTARIFNNLGMLYLRQEMYKQAEPLLQQALAIREQVLGSEHPDTLITLEMYKDLLRLTKGNPDEKS